jgi:hypothetical protein
VKVSEMQTNVLVGFNRLRTVYGQKELLETIQKALDEFDDDEADDEYDEDSLEAENSSSISNSSASSSSSFVSSIASSVSLFASSRGPAAIFAFSSSPSLTPFCAGASAEFWNNGFVEYLLRYEHESHATTGHKLQGCGVRALFVTGWDYRQKTWVYVVLS